MEMLIIPPVSVLIVIFVYWFFFIKEEPQTIAVFLEPPKSLSILECGVLVDDVLNTKDIALELYNLYLKGFVVKKNNDVYALNTKLGMKEIESLTVGQQSLLDLVFDNSGEFYSSKEGYKKSFGNLIEEEKHKITNIGFDFLHKDYLQRIVNKTNDLKLVVYDEMAQNGYFKMSPFLQRRPVISLGSVIFAAPLLWNIFTVIDGDFGLIIPWNLVGGIMISGFIIAYSSLFFVKKTKKGSKEKADFLGFKRYIVTAEKDRIRFVAKNNIDAYKKILPYAALFDSLEKWLEPLSKLKETLDPIELNNLIDDVSSIKIDASVTERNKWIRALKDLFWYGTKLIGRYSSKLRV
ncbi:hypothetical protein C0416_04540 [bacterium]|nr:hypothetical protein [bacterium]